MVSSASVLFALIHKISLFFLSFLEFHLSRLNFLRLKEKWRVQERGEEYGKDITVAQCRGGWARTQVVCMTDNTGMLPDELCHQSQVPLN